MNKEVQLKIENNNGLFYIKIDSKIEAEMTFELTSNNKMKINHTEVNDAHGGKGFGKLMLQNAVEYAREKNLKIIPLCSFVKSVIDKTPKYKDVL